MNGCKYFVLFGTDIGIDMRGTFCTDKCQWVTLTYFHNTDIHSFIKIIEEGRMISVKCRDQLRLLERFITFGITIFNGCDDTICALDQNTAYQHIHRVVCHWAVSRCYEVFHRL